MRGWLQKKRVNRTDGLIQPKELLADLLGHSDRMAVASATPAEAREKEDDIRAAQRKRSADWGMFGYLERKREKRLFYGYLHRFELTEVDLGSKVSRLILKEIHHHSRQVARQFGESPFTVCQHILGAAAWGTIYCLLGPYHMLQIHPDYREIVDEVELDVMISYSEQTPERSIYRRVFSILSEQGLCHPEVNALIHACIASSRKQRLETDLARGSEI